MRKLIVSLTFLTIFVLFLKPLTDPDLFWHLKYGEEILKTHRFPYADQFSFTFPGYQAADSWWLSEVLIYFLVSKTGFFFPALLFAALGAVSYLAVGFWTLTKGVNPAIVAGSVFFSAIVSWQVMGVRPQVISLAFLAVAFIILHQFWQNRHPKLIFFMPLIFLLWANFHAGFTLGLLLIWLFWATEMTRFLGEKFWRQKREIPYLTSRQLKFLLGVNFFSVLITLVNPYGVGLWQTVLNDTASPKIKILISEWLPPTSRSELGLLFFFYLFVLGFLIYFQSAKTPPDRAGMKREENELARQGYPAWSEAEGGVVHLSRIKINPTRLVILAVFSLLGLAAVRHIAVFGLLAIPVLVEGLAALPLRKVAFSYKNLVPPLFLVLFAGGWAFQILPQTYRSSISVKDLAGSGGYPYEAVEYLKKNAPERLFNVYGWGGYLIWQAPGIKTFIDGRMPGWKRDGREILDDYDKIINLKKEAPELLDFWQIRTVLISPDSPLTLYLKIHPQWEKRYEDSTAVIFSRKVVK